MRPAVAGADRHPGWNALRTIAARITTPLLPDDYLHLANPLWSARELRGRVLEVRRETEDSATLVIKPGWGFSFDYEPGQYVGIGVLMDGRWRWRSYSLTSSPVDRRRAPSPSRSRRCRRASCPPTWSGGVAPGTVVRLAAPQGNFVMPDPAPASVLFLTAGLRHHPGDVDAAHPGAPRSDHRHRARALGADRGRCDVRPPSWPSWPRDASGLPAADPCHPVAGPAGSGPAR